MQRDAQQAHLNAAYRRERYDYEAAIAPWKRIRRGDAIPAHANMRESYFRSDWRSATVHRGLCLAVDVKRPQHI